jgi:signal transduction histidine kinase
LKTAFSKSLSEGQTPAALFAALALVALVPAVCILWFMSVAMRNDRLAVQDRLTAVYRNHIDSLQRQLTAHLRERRAALSSVGRNSPAYTFATIIRANLADSVVVLDGLGKVLYPSSGIPELPLPEKAEWITAREFEFQKQDYPAAIESLSRILKNAPDVQAKGRALQSAAECLLKMVDREQALRRLSELSNDPNLLNAASPQGTLIVPNAQLLTLKTLAARQGSGPAMTLLHQKTLDDLVARLNEYSDTELSSSQRQFLMNELKAIVPGITPFPTQAAEELAMEYLEQTPAPAIKPPLQRTHLAKVWCLPSSDRMIVGLFRENRLRTELGTLIDSLALPGLRVTLLLPGESFASVKPLPPQDASELLPGWQLGLSFMGNDPLANASAHQNRVYLWTGSMMVVIIAMVALLVARYVGAQMRLARLKNDLVSTVSHELKTPLASMRALVDTLAAGRFRDERQLQDYLQLIAKENLRLSQLIETFLSFSRMERGKQRFHFEDLEPASVVRVATQALKEKLELQSCCFDLQIAAELPRIRGDAEALATVLINLLDNACKYTNAEQRIALRTYALGRDVCFEVEDNGIGLAPAEARKIFDRFYQVDQSLTRTQGGCGLGLGIVKFIVEAHGGTVEVQSEPGKGCTFRVTIPVAARSGVERVAS